MKEAIKQLLMQTAKGTKDVLKQLAHGAKATAVAIHKDYRNAQQIKQNQIQQNQRLGIISQIQWELFCVFCGKKYPYLKVVEVVGDIVPFSVLKYGILFENSSQTLPSFAPSQVKDLMNYDINSFRQWLLATHTIEDAWRLFPCIMRGMYIADITANGIYAVLTVVIPQQN